MRVTHFSIYLVGRPTFASISTVVGILGKPSVHGFGRIPYWDIFGALASSLEVRLRIKVLRLKLPASP